MDINNIAAESDKYSSRRKITRPKYDRLREELIKFAQGRAEDKHHRGVPWFRKHGIPALEQATGETIPHDVAEGTLLDWLADHHPELREVFRG